MVVEADLADGEDLGMRGEVGEARERFVRRFRGVVRVDADSRIDEGVALGEAERYLEVGRAVARADGEQARDARGERAFDGLLAIFVELRVVEVAVGIDEGHFRRAPTGMSSWKPARTGLPSATDAATIIPCDSMPFNLRGWRLATMTTLRPTICSGV